MSGSKKDQPWILHYWGKFVGRAEFVRLVFEEAGVRYEERHDLCEEYFHGQKCRFGEVPMFPCFAPPMLQKGDFYLTQTGVICKFLAKKFGFLPESEEDQWHAEQVNCVIHDFIAEGCNAFHGIHPIGSYASQKEETQPYIDRFVAERLPSWLKHFEAVLRYNNEGQGFVIGDKLTYVDLALLHVLRATEAQFPEAWKAATADYAKLLKAFKERMSSRPKLVAYFASDRCQAFCGESMM